MDDFLHYSEIRPFTIIIIAQHSGQFVTLSSETHRPLKGLEAADTVLQTLLILSEPSNRIAIQQELTFLFSARPGDLEDGVQRAKQPACGFKGTRTDVVFFFL
jgi:hypothetical protein